MREYIFLFLCLLIRNVLPEEFATIMVRDEFNRIASSGRFERSSRRCEEGSRSPNERECTSYFECVNGRKTLRLCQYGSYYNPQTGCEPQPESESDFVCPRPPPPPPPPPPECEYGEMRADPTDCSAYFSCVGGERPRFERRTCRDTERFNSRSSRCEPGPCGEDMSCNGGSCQPPTPPRRMCDDEDSSCQPPPPPPPPRRQCGDEDSSCHPPPPPPRRSCEDDDSCPPDMSCSGNSCPPPPPPPPPPPTRRACEEDSCQPPRRSCNEDSCQQQQDTSCRSGGCRMELHFDQRQEPECVESSGRNGYKPDPQNCRSFFQCAQGQWVRMNCPSNLVWNQLTVTCDWPKA